MSRCVEAVAVGRCFRLVLPVVALLTAAFLIGGCSIRSHPTAPGPDSTGPSAASGLSQLESALDDQVLRGPAPNRGIRGMVIRVNGTTRLERYWSSSPDDYHHVFSLTKSVLSTLVGIALEDGVLPDADANLAQLLPRYRTIMSADVAAITIEQLLTMTSGIGFGSGKPPADVGDDDYVESILGRGADHQPGTVWQYSDAAVNVLAAVLTEALSHQHPSRTLLAYGREKLFDPLGIRTEPAYTSFEDDPFSTAFDEADFAWATDRMGRFFGDAGLKLRTADLADLGQLYLQHGRWKGEQLVPAVWTRRATVRSTDLAEYGRLWWPVVFDHEPAYAAQGYGGQLILVAPHRRLVIAVSADSRTELDVEDLMAMLQTTALPLLD
ncbi:MAG: serine hydrolase [Propionibacteriaceae bacterium]